MVHHERQERAALLELNNNNLSLLSLKSPDNEVDFFSREKPEKVGRTYDCFSQSWNEKGYLKIELTVLILNSPGCCINLVTSHCYDVLHGASL